MEQMPLFGRGRAPSPAIPGLAYLPAYVDEAEERALLEAIDAAPWRHDFRRRTQHYGVSYVPSARGGVAIAPPPIPAWLAPLAARLEREGHLDGPAANVVVNEYLPGQGIGAHRDLAPFGDAVAAVSLGSACLLDWTVPESGAAHALDVDRRSLFVFRGEARWRWMHGIAARRTDAIAGVRRARGRRVSVTFRTVRAG